MQSVRPLEIPHNKPHGSVICEKHTRLEDNLVAIRQATEDPDILDLVSESLNVLEAARQDGRNMEARLEERKSEAQELEKELSCLEKELSCLVKERADLQSDLQEAKSEIEQKDALISDLEDTVSMLREHIAIASQQA